MSSAEASRDESAERALLVLGCPAYEDGTPRPPLERRLHRALQFHRLYPRATVVVTGGPVRGPREGEVMARWLAERGVPEQLLRVEREALSTLDNMRNSLPLIPAGATVHLITERFHMARARALAAVFRIGPLVEEPVEDALGGWRRIQALLLERVKLQRDLAAMRRLRSR